MVRTMLGACLVSALLGFGLLTGAAPARAALIHDFIDTSAGNAVIGQIEFSAALPGTVTAFNLDLSGYGGPAALDLSNLCGPGGSGACGFLGPTSWSIDGAWNLNDFVLAMDFLDFFEAGSLTEYAFTFSNPASLGVTQTTSVTDCVFCDASLTDFSFAVFDLATSRVEVPEPSTMLMLLVGLLLLAAMARETGLRQPA